MKQANKNEIGFTLIELLVVIAIIGILASTVLAALGSSKKTASDGMVMQGLGSLVTQAELYRSANGNYGVSAHDDDLVACRGANPVSMTDTLFKDPEVMAITANVMTKMNSAFRPFCSVRSDGSGSWAFSAPLFNQSGATGDDERGWCVDSSGAKKVVFFDMNNTGNPLTSGSVARCP